MASRFRWTLTNLSDSSTEVLTKDPIGWEDMTLRLVRDKLYNGVFTEFSLSLRWHCEGGGKTFIDNIYQTEDVNGIITVLIEIDCDGSGTYTELYTGRLNLASYQTDGEYTTCNIEKSDLFSKLKSRDEISVDVESALSIGGEAILPAETQEMTLHSQKIFLESRMEGQTPFTKQNPHTAQNSFTYRGLISHALTNVISEAENFSGWIDYDDWGFPGYTTADSFMPEVFEAIDDDVEYPSAYTYRIHFAGEMTDTVIGSQTRTVTAFSLVLAYGADLATATLINIINTGGYTSSSATHTEPFDSTLLTGTISLNYGDKVWVYWFHSGDISTGPYNDDWNFAFDYDTAEFSLEINSITDPTVAKTILVHEALNQVADSISDTNYSLVSDFYGRTDSTKFAYAVTGCGGMIALSNGFNIRTIDKGIFFSLKDLFSSLNAIHNIGLTIEQYDIPYGPIQDIIRIEPLSYFYDNTPIITLVAPIKVETTNDNSRYYNSPVIGYEKWETEFQGGLDEPCAKHEYSTSINSIKGQYTKLSRYMASGYAIEKTRRKNDEQTEDFRYDNDNFIIAITRKTTFEALFLTRVDPLPDQVWFTGYTFNAELSIGDTFTISGSASNDGLKTIVEITYGDDVVVFGVVETLVFETTVTVTIDEIPEVIKPERYDDAFSAGSGMTSLDTAYNLRLTPARMLLAHMNQITACLQIINGQIKFVNGEGNTDLATTQINNNCQEDYNSQSLSESQSFNWNDANVANISPLWLPEIYKFEYPLSVSALTIIRANPHGYIQFTDDHNNVRKGFILDMEYRLKTGKTKFELLKVFE